MEKRYIFSNESVQGVVQQKILCQNSEKAVAGAISLKLGKRISKPRRENLHSWTISDTSHYQSKDSNLIPLVLLSWLYEKFTGWKLNKMEMCVNCVIFPLHHSSRATHFQRSREQFTQATLFHPNILYRLFRKSELLKNNSSRLQSLHFSVGGGVNKLKSNYFRSLFDYQKEDLCNILVTPDNVLETPQDWCSLCSLRPGCH